MASLEGKQFSSILLARYALLKFIKQIKAIKIKNRWFVKLYINKLTPAHHLIGYVASEP
jgi:hypothetical protein